MITNNLSNKHKQLEILDSEIIAIENNSSYYNEADRMYDLINKKLQRLEIQKELFLANNNTDLTKYYKTKKILITKFLSIKCALGYISGIEKEHQIAVLNKNIK